MNGVIRKKRFYRIWSYGVHEKKLQMSYYTQDSVVSGGCGFFVTYKQDQSTINLHCEDSLLSSDNEWITHERVKIPCIRKLSLPDGKKLKEVVCGRNHIIALDKAGSVYSYGISTLGQCGVVDHKITYIGKCSMATIRSEWQVTKVACGLDHNLFLNNKGQIYACGWSADGQTGTGLSIVCEPKAVCGDVNNHKVTDIYCGANTSFATTDNHMVYAWGNNEYRQLGIHSAESQVTVPQPVDKALFGDDTVTDIAPGDSFTIFQLRSGQIFICGFGLGLTHRSRSHLQCRGDVIQCGLHYCLINNNKEIFLFESLDDELNMPTQVSFPSNIISLHTGLNTIYGISV